MAIFIMRASYAKIITAGAGPRTSGLSAAPAFEPAAGVAQQRRVSGWRSVMNHAVGRRKDRSPMPAGVSTGNSDATPRPSSSARDCGAAGAALGDPVNRPYGCGSSVTLYSSVPLRSRSETVIFCVWPSTFTRP